MDMEFKIDQILKIVTIVQQDVAEVKERVIKLEEKVTVLEEKISKLEERVTKLEERITKLEKRITSLEHSVFLIETEHGDKIKALFDARKANEDEHAEIKNLCLSIKSEIQGTLFSHEKRISNLEGNLVPSF
jgi:chromosome segregation ATPase